MVSSLTHILLEVWYSVSKYLGYLQDIFLSSIWGLILLWLENVFCMAWILLNLLSLVLWPIFYISKCSIHTQREDIMLLLSEVFYKCQLAQVDSFIQVFYIFSVFCAFFIKVALLKSSVIPVGLSTYYFRFLSFCSMYFEVLSLAA